MSGVCACGGCVDGVPENETADARAMSGYASCCLVLVGVASGDVHDEIKMSVDKFREAVRARVFAADWRDCERRYLLRIEGGGDVNAVSVNNDGVTVRGRFRRTRNSKRVGAACRLLLDPSFDIGGVSTREQFLARMYDGHERCSRRYGTLFADALSDLA